MPRTTVRANPSRLYALADEFRDALEANQQDAATEMLAAWSDTYWGVRQELDTLLAKVQAARDAGEVPSPAWGYQQRRLKAVLDATKAQVARYAEHSAATTTRAQDAAIRASAKHSARLAQRAVEDSLGAEMAATFVDVDPEALVENIVGLTGDGRTLAEHLRKTLPDEAVEAIRKTLVHGLATGKGQDWMVRQVTRNLATTHTRAVTIMRTESLRAYRETARQSYEANPQLVGSWVWKAHRDAACCVACVLMDGTEHPTNATLDGHPRCRCAMIPRTPSWEDLGLKDLPDTRPPLDPGRDWLEQQSETYQRALMGPLKFQAWKDGKITLDDMVARHLDPAWGTMRTERSYVAIQEGRDPNWWDDPTKAPEARERPQDAPPEPAPAPTPDPVAPKPLAQMTERELWASLPPSKYTLSALREFNRQLKSLDDESLDGQRIQRDPAVKVLVQAEIDRRRALKPQADLEREELERAEAVARSGEWLAGLPVKTGAPGTPQPYALDSITPAIGEYLDGVPGIDRVQEGPAGADYRVRDFDAGARALREAIRGLVRDFQAAQGAEADRINRRLLRARLLLKSLEAHAKGGADDVTDTNPRYQEGRPYQVNCTHVVSTYELRARGYDVTAAPLPDHMLANAGRSWVTIYEARWALPPGVTLADNSAEHLTRRQAERKMLAWGEGARVTLQVFWKRSGGGHVFNAVVRNGAVEYFDAQSGRRIDGADYWSRARDGKMGVYRMDNMIPTKMLEDLIVRAET